MRNFAVTVLSLFLGSTIYAAPARPSLDPGRKLCTTNQKSFTTAGLKAVLESKYPSDNSQVTITKVNAKISKLAIVGNIAAGAVAGPYALIDHSPVPSGAYEIGFDLVYLGRSHSISCLLDFSHKKYEEKMIVKSCRSNSIGKIASFTLPFNEIGLDHAERPLDSMPTK